MRFVISRCRLIVLLLLVVGGLLAAWFLYGSGYFLGKYPNVLLISIDTCRADRLSCYGYELATTPNIDALAAEGILFEHAISPVPQTLPAHGSMFTGTIPPYHGVHDNFGYHLDKSNITLAEILRDSGFTSGAVISAFVLDSQFGTAQGFDSYHDRIESPMQGQAIPQRQAGQTTRIALDWLEENKDKRFFFFLHYYDPHVEYEPPEPFASQFAGNLYAGEIAYTDHCIGQVIDKLKELGLYDSTLIIITSDHGEMLGEHGELTHSYFIYQGAIRVPLIFKLPGPSKPARIKSIAGIVDIVPPVCGLLNIETPKQVQGIDLSPSLKGEVSSGQDRHMFCESLWPTSYKANSLLGVVNDRFKYIQTTRPELYDLIKDPGESDNLVEEQRQRARIMQDKLAQILEQSVRKDALDSKMAMDPETIERLKSLGYAGGTITEDFSFDQTKDDPEDLLECHLLQVRTSFYLTLKQYNKAEMFAEQMIQLRPDSAHGYKTLGDIAMLQGDDSRAIVYLQKAIELEPDNAKVYNSRGMA